MPSHRIKDIHGMADFISQFPWVDTTLVGLLGICGGGAYSLAATQTDKRFKAVATISIAQLWPSALQRLCRLNCAVSMVDRSKAGWAIDFAIENRISLTPTVATRCGRKAGGLCSQKRRRRL